MVGIISLFYLSLQSFQMAARNQERNQDQDYNARYQKFAQNKDKMITDGLKTIQKMKADVKQTGNMVQQDNQILDGINRRGDEVLRTAQKNNNRMERYLQKTSDCQLYVIIACELLFFLVLMSL